jgi:hypothetical protein
MARYLFRDEAQRVMAEIHEAQERAASSRLPVSEEAAQAFHAEQRRRQLLEEAERRYYMSHDAESGPWDGTL